MGHILKFEKHCPVGTYSPGYRDEACDLYSYDSGQREEQAEGEHVELCYMSYGI